ncbi:MAG: fibronectin type III domain-containing protein [Nitrospirae bacterium]|nr:fibronectin type III domain-containing protein [Nitrospirota bacterium]
MFEKSIMERKQNFKLYHFYAKCLLLSFVFLTGCGGGGYSSGGGGMISSGCPSGMSILVVPAAPTNVSASSGPAAGEVTVTWSPVPGAASYNLYMAAVSGVTKSNYSTLSGGMLHSKVCSPFIHPPTLTGGTTYYFVVTAVNIYGESPDSAQASAPAK